MNIPVRLFIAFGIAASLFSCHRDPADPTQEPLCPSTPVLYGYRGPRADTADTSMPCNVGNINLSTGVLTGSAWFNNRTYYNQGAYHIGENAYYTFKREDTADTLYRVTGSSVTMLSQTAGTPAYLDGIVYDRHNDKLFCFVTTGTTSRICEIIVTGDTYMVNPVSYTTDALAYDNATVDRATGDIYFQTHNATSNTYNIRKYAAGSSSTPAVIYTNPDNIEMWGLRHNTNDNMLYALRESPMTANTYEFIRINPSGIMTVIANLGFDINPKYLSAALNPCDNRYVFATQVVAAPGPGIYFRMYQLNMSGVKVDSASIPEMYQGLDFWW